jgi:large subunit ribosomal protein L9
MEIILKEDMPRLGHKDDVIKVKDGYARNYLIPRGVAIPATVSAKKMLAENKRQRAHKEEKIRNEALEVAKTMEGLTLTIGTKTSTTGKIFGSVTNIQIAEALKAKGFDIDRKMISFKEDVIKEVGKYVAYIKLHREVTVELPFEVVSE